MRKPVIRMIKLLQMRIFLDRTKNRMVILLGYYLKLCEVGERKSRLCGVPHLGGLRWSEQREGHCIKRGVHKTWVFLPSVLTLIFMHFLEVNEIYCHGCRPGNRATCQDCCLHETLAINLFEWIMTRKVWSRGRKQRCTTNYLLAIFFFPCSRNLSNLVMASRFVPSICSLYILM